MSGMLKKGQVGLAPMVIGIVMSVIISAIIVYTVFFPTMKGTNTLAAVSLTGQTVTFATNGTYVDFPVQANCFDASLYPDDCGVPPDGVSGLYNATDEIDTGAYTWTTTQIELTSYQNVQNVTMGSYLVNYTYNDFNNLPTSQIGNFNTVLLLGGVIIIIVALVGFMMLVRLIQ